jgi:hypothetical protein
MSDGMEKRKSLTHSQSPFTRSFQDLGDWLIDPDERTVYIYRPDAEVECLENPESVSGEPLLKGFALNMKEVWG